jgi:hypothetical protein
MATTKQASGGAMPVQQTAQLLSEFQSLLDRLEGDSALRHDIAAVNRFEAMAGLIGEQLGDAAIRLLLTDALYRMARAEGRDQRQRHWVEFINRRRQILELVLAGRQRRQQQVQAIARAKPALSLVRLAKTA